MIQSSDLLKPMVYSHRFRARSKGLTRHFTIEQWQGLIEVCGDVCLNCGARGVLLSPDHVIPLVHGGSNTIENIQPLCEECNLSKGAETVDYRPEGLITPDFLARFGDASEDVGYRKKAKAHAPKMEFSHFSIKSNFQSFLRHKAYKEARNISMATVVEETGLSAGVIQRVSTGNLEKIQLSAIDILCAYFKVNSISELIEYVPANQATIRKAK